MPVRFLFALALAALAISLSLDTIRAQEAVPPAAIERETAARLDAGAERVAWVCDRAADDKIVCRERETGEVRFGDGKPGARLPARAPAAESAAARVQPSQQRVIVLAPGDPDLTEIGRALAADSDSRAALGRWSEIVEEELRAGRDPTRLIPAILDEARLQTVGDDAQLANIDLQDTLQKQQKTYTMLSNILKKLHDTAMAVIRKIGG